MANTNGQSNQTEMERLVSELQSEDETTRKYAAEDLGYGGFRDAVPYLIQGLTDPSIAVAETCATALNQIGGHDVAEMVAVKLASEDVRLRNYAVEILTMLRETSVPILEEQLNSDDRDVRKFAVDILVEIASKESLPVLIKALDDTDVNIAATAADGIGQIGDESNLPVLKQYMDSETWMQCAVIRGIGSIGGEKAMQAILPLIKDDDLMVKTTAIQALGEIAEINALPELFHLLNCESVSLYGEQIINSIYSIFQSFPKENYQELISENLLKPVLALSVEGGSDSRLKAVEILSFFSSQSIVEHLVSLFGADEIEILDSVVKALVKIDPEEITPLEKVLDESSESSNTQKVTAIRCLGSFSNAVGHELLRKYLDPNEEELACAVLDTITEGFEPVPIEELKALLKSHFSSVRKNTAMVMEKLGMEEFCEALIHQLDDEDEEVLECVDYALVAIGQNHENSLIRPYLDSFSPIERKVAFEYYGTHHPEQLSEKFIEGLQDPNEDIRVISFKVLGNLKLLTYDMVRQGMSDPVENVEVQAVRSLASFPKDQEMVDFIKTSLAMNPQERIKVELIQLLGDLAEFKVTDSLLSMLKDDSTWVVVEAVEALKMLDDDSVVGALEELLDSDNDEIVETVENAIEELKF